MKKVFIVIVLLFSSVGLFAQKYSGGSGTEADPYQIGTTGDLIELSITASDWDNDYILITDISFPEDSSSVNWNGDDTLDWKLYDNFGFTPIGSEYNPFTGSFDGQNHKISYIFIDRTIENSIGLFGNINSANIKNTQIINSLIQGSSNVASLVGTSTNSKIINCSSDCFVVGYVNVGGLVGKSTSYSLISECFTRGFTGGRDYVGGLVGANDDNSIVNYSNSTGNIIGSKYVGGLVGINDNNSIIYRSSASGNILGEFGVGGFIGYNYNESMISDCYSMGDITKRDNSTSSNFGSFCGRIGKSSSIIHCYSIGRIYEDRFSGFIGYVSGYSKISGNYLDYETSLQKSGSGATPRTTAEMKTQATFTDADWDFNTIWDIDPETNDGYPILRDATVGILEDAAKSESRILCFPNPITRGKRLNLSLEVELSDYTIKFYDTTGALAFQYTNSKSIHIPNDISIGAYFIVIESMGEIIGVEKIIIE